MTRPNEQLHIRIHERDSHCHRRTVWQNKIRILAELLDNTEDIVPTTAIQPGTMISQLIDDLEDISL